MYSKKKYLLTYFLLIFFSINHSCIAQNIKKNTPANLLTRFPFKLYNGGVIVVQALLGDVKDSLNFILDTGSGGISLDSTTCNQFQIVNRLTDTVISGIGGRRRVSFAFNQTLHLPNLNISNLNFHIADYDVLTSVYGEKIDGIIGYSFFKNYIVSINFDSLFIEIFTPGLFNYPAGGTTLHPVFTSIPIQYLNINDKKKLGYNFYFDTGAGLCLLLGEKFAKDSAILKSKRKPVVTQAQGMGGITQMRLTVIKSMKIGPYKFKQVPTYLYEDENNILSYPFIGGLVGNDLLRRFNMTINYSNREIHLIPNSHFDEPFDYAYTGLGFNLIDNKIIITDIIKNSPADKAKLKIGDEIIAVGNNFSYKIQVYKELLQVVNKEIKILIKRKKELEQVYLKIGRIQ